MGVVQLLSIYAVVLAKTITVKVGKTMGETPHYAACGCWKGTVTIRISETVFTPSSLGNRTENTRKTTWRRPVTPKKKSLSSLTSLRHLISSWFVC